MAPKSARAKGSVEEEEEERRVLEALSELRVHASTVSTRKESHDESQELIRRLQEELALHKQELTLKNQQIKELTQQHKEQIQTIDTKLRKASSFRFGIFTDLVFMLVALPKESVVLGRSVCRTFETLASSIPEKFVAYTPSECLLKPPKRVSNQNLRRKGRSLFGQSLTSGLIECAHLIPLSSYCRVDWVRTVRSLLPSHMRSTDMAERLLFGCYNPDKVDDCRGSITELPFNYVFLQGQREHLDSKSALMVLPLLTPEEQCQWTGEGYYAIVICADADIYRDCRLDFDRYAVSKLHQAREPSELGVNLPLAHFAEPIRRDFLMPGVYKGTRPSCRTATMMAAL